MEQFHQAGKGNDAGLYQIRIEQREGRFQSHDAHGAFFQSPSLFLGAVGGVIRGDHVDGSVRQTLQQRLPVALIA